MEFKDMNFIDHGIAAKSEEARTSVVSKARDGNYYFVVCSRGFVVSTNLNTGAVTQVFFPEGLIDFPFGSFCSSKGLVYTGAGKMFMEFDPVVNSFTYHSYPAPAEEIVGFRLAEDRNGIIYHGTYPSCHLVAYNPDTNSSIDYGSMDDTEKYVGSIAVDRSGWVYMGIGTERTGIVAFHPDTGEKRQLVKEDGRVKGCGYVRLGVDGNVYGIDKGMHLSYSAGNYEWKSLKNGEMDSIDTDKVSSSNYYGSGFHIIHSPFINAEIIKEYSLIEHELTYKHPVTGEEMHVELDYDSAGASLSPIVGGPDGIIYGTTNHPFQFFSYNPREDILKNWGGRIFDRGLGNICAYAVQGSIIGGAAYAGGFITMHDTSRPICGEGEDKNPSIPVIHDEIHRPRCAAAHPDGNHMIFGGFAGYGDVGGALCIYNAETGEDSLIENSDLLPYHSTMCIRVLKNGDLICGTSIETPGGAEPKVKEGEIYRLCWKTRKVIGRVIPIPGAREISLMEIDHNQLLHCITSGSVYFVFNTEDNKVLYTRNLLEYGRVVRDGLTKGKDGKIYGLLSKAIICIDPESYKVEILGVPPVDITAGIAICDDRLYFGTDRRLCSIRIPSGL